MSTIKYQKERIKMLEQMLSDEEHNKEIFEESNLDEKTKFSDHKQDLYEELEKEKHVLEIMEEGMNE